MAESSTIDALKGHTPAATFSEFREQQSVVVPSAEIANALEFLKDDCGFDLLVDITCVDYLNYRGPADRFGLVYILTNTDSNERLIVRTFLNEPDLVVPSVTRL